MNNSSRHRDARERLPREPYPGLRPFLDFEAALLFGRQRQVREVIEGLRQSQFVAVLGGSGSGKSSLIHAGVVPELRSYGIPGAGDLWLPMTCTPGTNVSATDSLARRHTPITRLARRFCGLLRSRGSEELDRQRETEVAEVFRQEAGFARLMDTYAAELDVPPGPDPSEARVLFVVDQFEELFHPTNQDVADVPLLVERVLDHFFNPHARCYVVLTMRSEHLNDCATYLELPDAINKSSYLIRRLDGEELKDAITGPAQRFLRLVARSAPPGQPLPEQVVFDDEVVQRLLRDVQAITHDPDHLPLLQHLLARLWEAALEREEMDVPVPGRITSNDLVRAVIAGASGDQTPLDDSVNTLRACVNNWPETLYQWHDPVRRQQLDTLFSQLAFKDPNTGLYSQQRIDVDEGALLLGPGSTRTDLRALIAEGFLGSVDYLFWDDDDPTRVTLKVSHESFIRGWVRFRALIDLESMHFNEFLGVLRKCTDWSMSGRTDDDLLQAGELRRLAGSGFAGRLAQPDKRGTWRRFLALDRDGARLVLHERALDGYFAASQQRQAEQQARETRAKRSARLLVVLTVLFALLPTALFSVLVQGPTMRRAELLFDAGNRANRASLNPAQATVGDASGTLQSMMRAAELIDSARTGEASARMGISRSLLQTLGRWPLFSEQREFLDSVFLQAEPPVNGTLRQLLTSSVWRADPSMAGATPMPAPSVFADTPCSVTGDGDGSVDSRGQLFVAQRRNSADKRPLRALFVPQRPSFDRTLEVLSASVDATNGVCTLGSVVMSSPDALDSRAVFDAGLRYVYYTAGGSTNPQPTVIVQEIDWERSQDDQVRALQRQTLTTISDPAAVAAVMDVVGNARAAVLPTWRLPGSRAVRVGKLNWRIVGAQAQRIDLDLTSPEVKALAPSQADSSCVALSALFAPMKGFKLEHFESESHCFIVARGWPSIGDRPDPTRPARDELRVAVHERPSKAVLRNAEQSPPAPVAGLVPFARVAPGDALDASKPRWYIGTSGPFEGWLLFRGPDSASQDRFIGLPWSTCALWRQGRDLREHNPLPGSTPPASTGTCAAS